MTHRDHYDSTVDIMTHRGHYDSTVDIMTHSGHYHSTVDNMTHSGHYHSLQQPDWTVTDNDISHWLWTSHLYIYTQLHNARS